MIKSARQVSFTIIVLTAISIQLGWFERERSERHAVYSYIEKVLTISEAIQSGLATASISTVSLTAKTPPILNLTAGTDNPAAIFVRSMTDRYFEEVTLTNDFDQLKTLGDPGGDCTVRLFRGTGPSTHGIEKINALSTEQRFSEIKTARNAATYLVLFGRACLYMMGDTDPVLVVHDPKDPDLALPSIVISPWVAKAAELPLDTDSNPENERFLYESLYPPETLEALSDLNDLTRPAYTESVLKAAAAREAMRIGGAPVELKDWRSAIAKIYERSARAPSIFGFNLPTEAAAFFLPLVLTPVVFSFLFRVRRIETLEEEEVWILTHSKGLFENLGAAIWFAALLAAPAATMWGLSAYAPHQVDDMFISLRIATFSLDPAGTESRLSHAVVLLAAPAFWALVATVLSTLMMARALFLLAAIRPHLRTSRMRLPIHACWRRLRYSWKRLRKK